MSNLYESNGAGDSELADYAIKWLKSHVFDFAFIYLGQTDEIAHREGWMSKQYLKSIQNADSIMGRVMDELSGDITYFITSDHGGHDRTHGTEMKSDMTIPLLIQGSGLTSDKLLSPLVSIMDIAPSILSLFEIPKPREWEGDNFFITDDL
jgi:phosphopentomutase